MLSAGLSAALLVVGCGGSAPPPATSSSAAADDGQNTRSVGNDQKSAQGASPDQGTESTQREGSTSRSGTQAQNGQTADGAHSLEKTIEVKPVAWQAFHYPLAPLGGCDFGSGPPQHGTASSPEVLASEKDFQRLFCGESGVDWKRERVVVWVQTRNSPNMVVKGTTVENGKLVVHWDRQHWCHGAYYGEQSWASAARVPSEPAELEHRVHEGPRPNCAGVP